MEFFRVAVLLAAAGGGSLLPGQGAPPFADKLAGALYGGAIGDAMGGPVEGQPSADVMARYRDWDFRKFLPSRQPGIGKGEGRITDDTLMAEALIRAYNKKRGHLDAYGFRDVFLPEIVSTLVWLPERQQEMAIIGRLNAIERYAQLRLAQLGAWPRAAGTGGVVNCGAAMYIMPVGAVNAGDPAGAYAEAVALAAAETESFGVEAAGALAAAYAAALRPNARIEDILGAVTELTQGAPAAVVEARRKNLPMWGTNRDETHAALHAVLAAVDPADDIPAFVAKVRAAFEPFTDGSIEEVPVALAALKYGQGDWLRTLRAAVLYGRDNDSIAGMAFGLFGAMKGAQAIPEELRRASDAANRRDWSAMAAEFQATVEEVLAKDRERWQRRVEAVGRGRN
jgi:ADP-ribosylglycohydrolase